VPLSSSKDPEIAFWALAVLLNAKVPGSLESLNKYLQTYEGNSTPIAWTGIDSDLHQIRDPEARPLLETLTESRHVPIRFGAMQALRKIKSPKSAPALVRRLDDSDRTVQYIAVISLAEILGKYEGDYAPAMPTFEKNPGKYTDLWKQWWAEHGQVPKK
jgi:HEAT repeat protein